MKPPDARTVEWQFRLREIATEMAIQPKMLVLAERHDPEFNVRVLTMMLKALTQPYHQHVYPADWWQAFKARWFPRWLQRRFPPSMTILRLERYCPHMRIPDVDTHAIWLAGAGPIEALPKEAP